MKNNVVFETISTVIATDLAGSHQKSRANLFDHRSIKRLYFFLSPPLNPKKKEGTRMREIS